MNEGPYLCLYFSSVLVKGINQVEQPPESVNCFFGNAQVVYNLGFASQGPQLEFKVFYYPHARRQSLLSYKPILAFLMHTSLPSQALTRAHLFWHCLMVLDGFCRKQGERKTLGEGSLNFS